ncbi:MAG: hypothetical protein K5931_03225, partial [Lachnospiraceae bacterium]|nr:hypothetical protein [Lachnospiraceae bacterium]
DFTKPLIDLLKEGRYKKSEIARELVEKSGRSYEEVYWLLSELWKQGVISETIFEKNKKVLREKYA